MVPKRTVEHRGKLNQVCRASMATLSVATTKALSHWKKTLETGCLSHTYHEVKGGWMGKEKILRRPVQQWGTWHLKLSCKTEVPVHKSPSHPLPSLRETAAQLSCFVLNVAKLHLPMFNHQQIVLDRSRPRRDSWSPCSLGWAEWGLVGGYRIWQVIHWIYWLLLSCCS